MHLPLKRWFGPPSMPVHTIQTMNGAKRFEWAGFFFGVIGAALLALNIEASPFGWVFFLVSNVFWIGYAIQNRVLGLLLMQVIFMTTSAIGIARWMA